MIDFMTCDSMGATKSFSKQYFIYYALYKNDLSFLEGYW